jgi:hypothetical protein
MGKKDDDVDANKGKTAKAAEPAPAPGPTVISGLPPEDYLTEQEKAAAAGKPAYPIDEEVPGRKAKKE